ncbi:MAG: type VI secretion system baseplate subunit TssF [Gemmatimonadales bacterium]|nr:MAG: type VI secretion system baseplate subunit TssF [Gemmatimonadales bacterium]
MREELLHYYERELTYLRRTGAEFARRYPGVAGRLELEPSRCDDPHVERLLEGVAFLAARIHLKVDDDLPEVSESLLQVLFPHHVRPMPAATIVQLLLDPDQGGAEEGVPVPRGTRLLSRPVGGVPCRFRTCYDTVLWPVDVEGVELVSPHELEVPLRGGEAAGMVLRVRLRARSDEGFPGLALSSLRFHLPGESGLSGALLEVLLNEARTLVLRSPDGPPSGAVRLDARRVVRPVGFEPDQTLLPSPRRSLLPHAFLQDYFAFPEKFNFVDVSGLDRLDEVGAREEAELLFLLPEPRNIPRLERLASALGPDSLRTGCTPVINLFESTSEPILLNQRRHEYPVVADARRRDTTGVWSVDEVRAVRPDSERPIRLRPFYSLDHGESPDTETVYWQEKRRLDDLKGDGRTEVSLSLVDLDARFVHPDQDSLTARITCFNEDLPSRISIGNRAEGDFELQSGGGVHRTVGLMKPSPVRQPSLGKARLWRLISQLSLNYTSLVDGGGEGLRELLRLHNPPGNRTMERQIEGVRSVRGTACHSRIETEQGLAFARGQRIEIEFDEEGFAGGSAFLLAQVLEHFMGRFVSLNSFTILSARSRQQGAPIREWPPRSGSKVLL